jgi:hypothetical protein
LNRELTAAQADRIKLIELASREHRSLNKQIEFILERSLRDAAKDESAHVAPENGVAGNRTAERCDGPGKTSRKQVRRKTIHRCDTESHISGPFSVLLRPRANGRRVLCRNQGYIAGIAPRSRRNDQCEPADLIQACEFAPCSYEQYTSQLSAPEEKNRLPKRILAA